MTITLRPRRDSHPVRRAARPIVRALATGAIATAAAGVSPALAVELAPHRAVYDIALERAEPSAAIAEASGRLVFELTGNACEGYAVNLRFVTRISDREGQTQVTDVRSSTTETLQPARFAFQNRTLIDDDEKVSVSGEAQANAGGVAVTLTEPKETEIALPRAIFPTAHTRLILEAALDGERVQEVLVYDGGDDADALYETTAVIGEAATGRPGARRGELPALSAVEGIDTMRAWRIVLSYFKADGEPGERVPDQELTFSLLENGVSYNAVFDYGIFALRARLAELTVDPIEGDCASDASAPAASSSTDATDGEPAAPQ